MLDLTGKAALVTGGARGIGKAICLTLARQGADVAFVDVGRPEVSDATLAEIQALGRKAVSISADVTDPEACVKAVATALEAFGKLDILVNNAGITRDDLIMRMPIDDWRKVLEVNLFGAFYMIKAAIRPMLKAHAGRIINMSSVSGQAGQMGQSNYSSSKAGLIGLTKATAKEVASRGITCNAVAPGFILTELTKVLSEDMQEQIKKATPLGHFGDVQDIANAVTFLASDEAAYVTGQVLAVDGGLVMM
jgi:3-oxoacyl-[acyl-carrier protein] reductase